jgi:hypothetical protein
MKKFTRADQASRKAEEITPTPDRSSSRVQGKQKMIRGDMNPFAPLREDNDDEDEEDVTMKEATTKSGGGSARKETPKKSGEDETMETREPFFRRYFKAKSVATEDSMGGKPESSSTSPIPSVLANSAGTPARVSFATTTGRNVTDLNKLKPTAKEKTGDVDVSGSPVADTGGGNRKIDERVINISDTTGRNETELNNLKPTSKEKTGDVEVSGSPVAETGGGNRKKGGRASNSSDTSRRNNTNTKKVVDLPTSTTSILTPRIIRSTSYATAAAGKKQDKRSTRLHSGGDHNNKSE